MMTPESSGCNKKIFLYKKKYFSGVKKLFLKLQQNLFFVLNRGQS